MKGTAALKGHASSTLSVFTRRGRCRRCYRDTQSGWRCAVSRPVGSTTRAEGPRLVLRRVWRKKRDRDRADNRAPILCCLTLPFLPFPPSFSLFLLLSPSFSLFLIPKAGDGAEGSSAYASIADPPASVANTQATRVYGDLKAPRVQYTHAHESGDAGAGAGGWLCRGSMPTGQTFVLFLAPLSSLFSQRWSFSRGLLAPLSSLSLQHWAFSRVAAIAVDVASLPVDRKLNGDCQGPTPGLRAVRREARRWPLRLRGRAPAKRGRAASAVAHARKPSSTGPPTAPPSNPSHRLPPPPTSVGQTYPKAAVHQSGTVSGLGLGQVRRPRRAGRAYVKGTTRSGPGGAYASRSHPHHRHSSHHLRRLRHLR